MQIPGGGRRNEAETGQLEVDKGLLVLLDNVKASKEVDRTFEVVDRASGKADKSSEEVGKGGEKKEG